MDKKITVGNVCFIRNEEKTEVLLLHRNREPMQGLWTGVGGKTAFEEDIHSSCLREIKEETGLDVFDLQLKGVIKTILPEFNSAWILFAYTATTSEPQSIIPCDEGALQWVKEEQVYEHNLVGFIRPILPYLLEEGAFVEGTFEHDRGGQVLSQTLIPHQSLITTHG